MKYGKRIVDKICELIASDDYTIPEICQQVGISRDTYHTWKKTKPDFSDRLKKADEIRLEKFKAAARSGLLTLLKGKEYEEVTTEWVEGKPDKEGNVKPKIKSKRTVKKFILPNPTSVIFALKNLDSNIFADIIRQQVTGRDGKDLFPEKSDDELKDLLRATMEKLNDQ